MAAMPAFLAFFALFALIFTAASASVKYAAGKASRVGKVRPEAVAIPFAETSAIVKVAVTANAEFSCKRIFRVTAV